MSLWQETFFDIFDIFSFSVFLLIEVGQRYLSIDAFLYPIVCEDSCSAVWVRSCKFHDFKTSVVFSTFSCDNVSCIDHAQLQNI